MLPPEHFDAFMRDCALLIAREAHTHHERDGRGMMVVRFANPDDPAEFTLRYVPAAEAVERGFSGEILKAIDHYKPGCEAVIFVECGDGMKLLLAQFSFKEANDD